MGSICSGATKAALPIYNDAKIVSISPSATTPELTQKGDHPYFFRTIMRISLKLQGKKDPNEGKKSFDEEEDI